MKAILILDMPSCCADCQLYDSENKQCYGEPYNDIFLNNFDEVEDKINPNCRLKLLPRKMNPRANDNMIVSIGWNDCLDEILGEENESTR